MISIIVPAFNEEREIPFLLESIKEQSFKKDYEIIVADNNSSDRTVEVAKKYGCRISPGGSPAKARNKGALEAKGNLFLFVDADTVLPYDFLENSVGEFEKRNLDVAAFFLLPRSKNVFLKIAFNLFYNVFPALISEKFVPHATNTILVKKSLHEKLGGFDESIIVAEDHFYAREGGKIGRFGLIRSSNIFVSTRRFKEEGLFATYLKYVLMETYTFLLGPIKTDVFNYKLVHYNHPKKTSFLGKFFDSFARILKEFLSFIGILISLPIVVFVFLLTIFLKILKLKA